MQPEDKIQEIAERAERLQEIGSSILRAARDELYLGMRFLDVALSSFVYQMDSSVSPFEQFFLSDGWSGPWIWNGWKSDVFPAADAGRLI